MACHPHVRCQRVPFPTWYDYLTHDNWITNSHNRLPLICGYKSFVSRLVSKLSDIEKNRKFLSLLIKSVFFQYTKNDPDLIEDECQDLAIEDHEAIDVSALRIIDNKAGCA